MKTKKTSKPGDMFNKFQAKKKKMSLKKFEGSPADRKLDKKAVSKINKKK